MSDTNDTCNGCGDCNCEKAAPGSMWPEIVYQEPTGLRVLMVPVKGPDGADVAGHRYEALHRTPSSNPSTDSPEPNKELGGVLFQNGPIPANGVNGWTNEALLAVIIDRTERLNAKFPCAENTAAIEDMKSALHQFQSRTRARQARGVEGKLVA